MLIEEIEKHIRSLIARSGLSREQLIEAVGTPSANDRKEHVGDLSFGDYVRVLQNPEWWSKLQLLIDRKTFVSMLDEVREIRNDVMHFGTDKPYLDPIRKLAALLKKLHRVRASRH